MANSTSGLTDQQVAAIYTRDISVSMSAGAGCGKTFVLTRRFLSYLEPNTPGGIPLSGLVAITFTERAAREMRERIRGQCLNRLQSCPPEEVDHWLKISREIDSARISTIHSFCASILRNAAVESNLDPRFGLLDPGISLTFRRRAVSEAIHIDLAKRDSDTLIVVQEFGLKQTVELCEALLSSRFEMLQDDWAEWTPDRLGEHWKTLFQEFAPTLAMNRLRESQIVNQTLEALGSHLPNHPEMLRRATVVRQELNRFLDEPDEIKQPLEWLLQLRENAKIQGGGGKKVWPSEEIYEAINSTFKELRSVIDKARESIEFKDGEVLEAASLSLQVFRVAQRAIAQYEKHKIEAAILDFDDLLLRTRNILRDNEAVRRRVSAGIEHLMVDEFQDTDPIQADIVRALCGSDLARGKLFLVGDAQQSIYRFRRADPQVFHQLSCEFPAAGRLPLNKNFRSQPAILNFVNSVFSDAFEGDIFQPLVPNVAQISPEPSIEFLFANSDDAEVMSSTEGRRRLEGKWIAGRIKEILSDPTPRVRIKNPTTGQPTLRAPRLGDFVILFRALTDVRYYEEALREYQLEYYLVGGRAFFAQQEVFDLVNLLQYLIDPENQIALLGCLRSPLFGLSDDTIMTLIRSAGEIEKGLLDESLTSLPETQRELVRHAQVTLQELRSQKDHLSITELMQQILDKTAYDASLLTEFLGSRKLANLRKLLEMARQFDRIGGYTLADFVERLTRAVGEETDEAMAATQAEADDVIRLMSIHQSKGLEFPIVIVADMDRGKQADSSKVEFQLELGPMVSVPEKFGYKPENLGLRLHKLREASEEAEEHLRLLYVALTRAADQLILAGSMKRAEKPSSGWLRLIAERFDLETGEPRIDATTGLSVIPQKYCQEIPPILVHRVPPRSPIILAEGRRQIPLKELRESVSASLPSVTPALLNRIDPDPLSKTTFSVSFLEQIDAKLVGTVGQTNSFDIQANWSEDESSKQNLPAEELGTLVHAVLERIDCSKNEQNIDQLIQACWTGAFSDLSAALLQTTKKIVSDFMSSPIYREMTTSRQCHREMDFRILVPQISEDNKPRFVTGQIDCLYQDQTGRWVIVDYKTGDRFRPHQTKEILEHYEFQLGVYAWAITAAFGQLPESVELITFRPEFSRLKLAVTPESIRSIQERVMDAIQEAIRIKQSQLVGK